jgi:hypothetical protein
VTNCSKSNPIVLSILLLIGSLGIFVIPQIFRYPGGVYEYWDPTTYSEVLTDTNPTLQIEFKDYESRVAISNLETNNTPITIFGYSENNQSIIQMRNVTELVHESLIINTLLREAWFLNITKQSESVEVSLTISIRYMAVIDFLVALPIPPFIFFVIIFLYAFRGLYKLDRDCGIQIGRKLWDKREGPLLIIILIVVGGGLVAPFMIGIIAGDFEIVEHEETTDQSLSFSINESVDSIQIDLTEGDIYTITIQSYTPQNASLNFIMHRAESIQQLGLVNLSESIYWVLDIKHTDDSMLALEIVRVDTDVDLGISLEIHRRWLAPKVGIVIPEILAAISCFILVYALVITKRIHNLVKLKEIDSEKW